MAKTIFTQEELQSLCYHWQERLRLQDWNIRVLLVDQSTMRGMLGQVEIASDVKSAIVHIPTAESFQSSYEKQDMHWTLVHELLHLHVDLFMPKRSETPQEFKFAERALNTIAKTLVKGYRENADLRLMIQQIGMPSSPDMQGAVGPDMQGAITPQQSTPSSPPQPAPSNEEEDKPDENEDDGLEDELRIGAIQDFMIKNLDEDEYAVVAIVNKMTVQKAYELTSVLNQISAFLGQVTEEGKSGLVILCDPRFKTPTV